MQSFPSYLETIRHLDRVLRSLRCPPTWTLEGDDDSTILARIDLNVELTISQIQVFSGMPARRRWGKQKSHSQLRQLFKSL